MVADNVINMSPVFAHSREAPLADLVSSVQRDLQRYPCCFPTSENGSGAIGATAGGSESSGAPAASLTTTRNNSWVFGVGNDYDNPIARTVGSGQTLIHQYMPPVGDTYWVQRQNSPTPASGTTVTINDTAPTTDRYNVTICEILPAP